MAAERTHRDLTAWQSAMYLAEVIYQETEAFPKRETYGLAAQMRRAAVSIPSNIAEGAARTSSREFYQYLGIAIGSVAELETQVELAMRLGYVSKDAAALMHKPHVGSVRQAPPAACV